MLSRHKYLIVAAIHYVVAMGVVGGVLNTADKRHTIYNKDGYLPGDNSGYGGAALGLGVVAAALIVCGSFFLYKAFPDTKK